MRPRALVPLLFLPLAALLAFWLRARDADARDGAVYVVKLTAGG